MRIFLVRHGQTLWNASQRWQGSQDIPLNETGLAQAARLAEKMKPYPITAIYSSPLLRAAATAQAVGEALGVAVRYRDDLKEISLGTWEGKTLPEIHAEYADAFAQWETNPHAQLGGLGVENNHDLQQRAWRALEEISQQMEGDTLIVTHGAWINRLVCKLLHIPLAHRMNFILLNAGVSIVKRKETDAGYQYSLVTLNDASHIDEKN